jgi:hypothetical protein
MQFSLIISSLLGPNILFSILSLYASFNVRDQVSNPYKTTGKIILSYTLIFTYLDIKRENKMFWSEAQQATIKKQYFLMFNVTWS